jgi:hypothetical protein
VLLRVLKKLKDLRNLKLKSISYIYIYILIFDFSEFSNLYITDSIKVITFFMWSF